MRVILNIIKPKLFFICTFLILFYLFFPYFLLKEILVSKINAAASQGKAPFFLEAKDAGLYYPIGFSLKDVKVQGSSLTIPHSLRLSQVNLRLSIWALAFGKARVKAHFYTNDGSAQVILQWKLFSLLSGKPAWDGFALEFDNFPLDDAIPLSFTLFSQDPQFGPIAKALIDQLRVSGRAHGQLDFLPTWFGSWNELQINFRPLVVDASAWGAGIQNFSEAGFRGEWDGITLKVAPQTRFTTADLQVQLGGAFQPAAWNLEVDARLMGHLQNNFGFLLPQLFGCPATTGNTLHIKLLGPPAQCQKL